MSPYVLEVNKSNLTDCHIKALEAPSISAGEVLLTLEKVAITANTITYGVAGDALGYWQFFPTTEPLGRIPCWGIAKTVKSCCDGIVAGERFYGYFPMGSHLLVSPEKISDRGFSDAVSHRSKLPMVYNQYSKITATNGFDPVYDDYQILIRPLFITSFIIDDMFEDDDYYGAQSVLVTSASSKTSFTLAHLLKKRPNLTVMGLTSKGNLDFVKQTGLYDQVLTYDDITSLDASVPSAIVDMAGNLNVISDAHHHFKDNIRASIGVGRTHWQESRSNIYKGLPGARVTSFFAPTRIEKRIGEWGPAMFQKKMHDSWTSMLPLLSQWVDIEYHEGQEALKKCFIDVANGTDPTRGIVVVP